MPSRRTSSQIVCDDFDRRQRLAKHFLGQCSATRADDVTLGAEFFTQLLQDFGRTRSGIDTLDVQSLRFGCHGGS